MKRSYAATALLLVGSLVAGQLLISHRAWGWGSAPPVPPPAQGGGQPTWRDQFQEGKQLFRRREFAKAVPLFASLAKDHPEDPWPELYLRVSRLRLQQPTTLIEQPPVPQRPAILRVMGLPPVIIQPMERPAPPPPPPPATAPAPAATAPAPPSTTTIPTAPGVPPIVPAVPSREEAPPEPTEPYPQQIPLPSPGPLTTTPPGDAPVQAHADVIEFSPELQRVIGRGHVRITHEDVVLTCDRVTVFTQSRDALAEGHVRLLDPDGLLTGETAYYNFATKKGTVLHGGAEFFPWYSRSPHMVKTSQHTVLVRNGYVTTCDLYPPHYRIQAKHATVHLDDKVVARNAVFYVGRIPLWYFPRWKYSLRENRNKFSFFPGKRKPWGHFVLGKYRYELNANAKGTLHWDWRRNFGHAQGLDFKYRTQDFGYGLFRSYFNDDSDHNKRKEELLKGQDQRRYRLLLRHRWDLDPSTNLILDFQKYSDVDFRRDFLFREEFQNETSPESYLSFTRSQPGYTFSTVLKKRVNRFQAVSETLPEVKLDLREQRVQDTRLYYNGEVTVGNYNSKTAHSDNDSDVRKMDVFNQLKYAMKWFRFYSVTPRMSVRQTYFSKDKQGGAERPDGERHFLRGVFSTGVDVSTKLYRIFNAHTDWWGLNIRGLRHIVTPTFSYTYTHDPTVPASNLLFSDGIERQNSVTLGLENKLQAKQLFDDGLRKTDMVRFLLSFPYNFKPENGSRWGEVTGDLEVQPYPWLRLETDVTYDHRLDDFQTWNVDLAASGSRELRTESLRASEIQSRSIEQVLEKDRPRWTVGVGHRYEREARSEMTAHVQFQPHPKWWFDVLTRFTYKDVAEGEKRINNAREFQLIVTRDLHDWLMQVTLGEDRDLGGIFMVSFVLKAFPETPVTLEDSYHRPKQGSQASAFYRGTPYYKAPEPPSSSP